MKKNRILSLAAAVAAICLSCVAVAGCGPKADSADVAAPTVSGAAATTAAQTSSSPPSAEAAAGAAEFERQRQAALERDKQMAAGQNK
jgi:hypothetical protein